MPKIRTQKQKNSFREMLISYAIKHNYSFNETQRILKIRHVGIRRKVLLNKLRVKKQIEKKAYPSKYIPKKYIKKGYALEQWKKKAVIQKRLFRISLAIKGIPLHSSSSKPVYYGFLMQAFSNNPDFLRQRMYALRRKMLELMAQHLQSANYVDDLKGYIKPEYPIEIIGSQSLINIWKFKVERNGTVIDSAEGNLQAI